MTIILNGSGVISGLTDINAGNDDTAQLEYDDGNPLTSA